MQRHLLIPISILAIIAIGCQTGSDTANGPVESSESTEKAVVRPDALNPVNGDGNIPEGWVVRADRGTPTVAPDSTGEIRLVNMTPGWHVTSGPAAIYYHPNNSISGDYSVSANIFLFNPGSMREAFGVFIGGSDLEGPNQSYSYFLIRQGSQFLVKNREGSETASVLDWTDNEAIKSFVAGEGATAENKLEVRVVGDNVEFLVNDTSVSTTPRSSLKTNGVVGLRVNHGLNLHISDLTVTQL